VEEVEEVVVVDDGDGGGDDELAAVAEAVAHPERRVLPVPRC
jgi:hypothetical protein